MTDATPTPTPHDRAAPVGDRARIVEMDVARGFALLGIFLVNLQIFARPLGEYLSHGVPSGSSGAETAAFYFVKVFCEGKFYPLFSLLFGMGAMAQAARAEGAGRPFEPLFVRKQALLALLGATHAILLWYGDILFVYAFAGLVLLLVRRWKSRSLFLAAGALFAFSTLVWSGLASLEAVFGAAEAPTARAAQVESDASGETTPDAAPPDPAPATPESARDALAVLEGAAQGAAFDPQSEERGEAETLAFRDGPYSHAVLMRLMNWITFLVVTALALGWHILAVFFLGAALMKRGLFSADHDRLIRRLVVIGLGAGLPLSALGAFAPALLGPWGAVVEAGLINLAGPLVALGYLCAVTRVVRSGRWPRLMRTLASAGRMALTVYLLESLLASAVFQHWGFAQFGQWGRIPRLALGVGIYAALVLFANLWLRAFRMGPVEWLWRTGTYLRLQPLRRRGRGDPANPE